MLQNKSVAYKPADGKLVYELLRRTNSTMAIMLDADVLKIIEQSAHEVLEWIGFGTIVGLAAKALMPGWA